MPFFTKKEGSAFVRRKQIQKLLVAMKLSFVLMLVTTLQVSAIIHAQTITADYKKAEITTVLDDLRKKTGYNTFYRGDRLAGAKPVTAKFVNAPLTEVLRRLSEGQPFEMQFNGTAIVVKRRGEPEDKIEGISRHDEMADVDISGRILTEDGRPIAGATIQVKGARQMTISDEMGRFKLSGVNDKAVLLVTSVGYQPEEIPASAAALGALDIKLAVKIGDLQEVVVKVNTGFEEVASQRMNGAVSTVDEKLFNRRVSSDVLSRINGTALGVFFNPASTTSGSKTGITIRGQSTVSAFTNRDPLIILDNFPFEGDPTSLNPNDVESITVLKDATAAAIWGARSGNGVVVITTRKGHINQKARIGFNSNITIGARPDINYDKRYLNSKDYIGIERTLYDSGYYNSQFNDNVTFPAFSPAVEIFHKLSQGIISQSEAADALNRLSQNDYRGDYNKYIYRNSVAQQYAVNVSGGGNNMTYYFSAGYDKSDLNLVRNKSDRITLKSVNTYTPTKFLDISSSIYYVQSNTANNNTLGWGNLTFGSGTNNNNQIYSYADLADENGNYLPISRGHSQNFIDSLHKLGFLNWQYFPLKEIEAADNTSRRTDLILNLAVKFKITTGLTAELQYQNEKSTTNGRNLQTEDSYYTRDLINLFSQYNTSTKIIKYQLPKGGILNLTNNTLTSNNYRGRLTYSRSLGDHSFSVFTGMEIRETKTSGYSRLSYGYNKEYGSATNIIDYVNYLSQTGGFGGTIPAPRADVQGSTIRFISYFANGSYIFKEKYSFSGSARREGSNIFGVKTNDRVSPLWQFGPGWEISKEGFYHLAWLPYLKLRGSYGFTGNVYNGAAYLTAVFGNVSPQTNFNYGIINTAPNPELRWERVKNVTVGLDFRTKKNIISGNVDFYAKNGIDLIEDIPIAPSTGFSSFRGNRAKTATWGFESQLNSQNLSGKLSWTTNLLFSFIKDKVKEFSVVQNPGDIAKYMYGAITVDHAIGGLYSFNMAGLDPTNGDPIGYLGKSISKEYAKIVNNTSLDSLIYHGSTRPQFFGALRNTLSYKGFSLSANITFKFKYYFRRETVDLNYQNLLNSLKGVHSDYTMRWQKSGDELVTTVPSLTYQLDDNRSSLYKYSQNTVVRGDHIRLQDISLSYDFGPKALGLPFSNVQLYTYVDNVGIIWRKNRLGIDPDFIIANELPAPRRISFGIKFNY